MNIRLGLVVAMGLMLVGAVGVRAGAPQSAIDQWRARRFEFQTSVDGKTWKNVFSGNKIGSNFERNFIPVKARWVRLNIRDASEGATIWEFQVFPAKKR
jgi:hypothetical protein